MRWLTILSVLFAATTTHAQFRETIDVVRILLDVRATEFDGTPVTDLTADDFVVTIGRKRAAVESATWIPAGRADAAVAPAAGEPGTEAVPATRPGRLFVVFVQTDFARDSWRVSGQMKFRQYAEDFIESLAPEDRVAVFSFDSHLKFRSDLTTDKAAAAKAVRDSLFIDHPDPPPAVDGPSLAERLDRDAMRRAPSSEHALLIVANALKHIDGPKSLLLLGWGLGDLVAGSVRMKPVWTVVRHALDAARTTIFSLDTTWADYHDLEIGLTKAAVETGGFYAKTHVFPSVAVARLERTLSGHYELEVHRPRGLKPGSHALNVRVKRRGVTVLAPTTYSDRP